MSAVGGWWALRQMPPPEPRRIASRKLPVGPIRVRELEPNDSAEQSQQLQLPAVVSGVLGVNDRDRYSFSVNEPGGHLLTASLELLTGAQIVVLRSDGAELARAVPPTRIGNLGLIPGQYTLVVEPAGAAAAGEYNLSVRLVPWNKGLDWEPDDDPEHAQDLAVLEKSESDLASYQARGFFSHASDRDCYKVPFLAPPAGARLRFELLPPPRVLAAIEIFDSGDAEVGIVPRRLSQRTAPIESARVILPALGARSWEKLYFVCVTSISGLNPAESYRLDVRVWTPEEPYEFEPNDTSQSADALAPEVKVRGFLSVDDSDWFRLSAGTGTPTVEVQPAKELRVILRLFSERGTELAMTSGAPGQTVRASMSGATFAQIGSDHADTSDQSYHIVLTYK